MSLILLQIFGTALLLTIIIYWFFWRARRKKVLQQFHSSESPEIDDFEELLRTSFSKSYNGDYEGAIEYINGALKIKPHMERLYYQRGKIHEELKQYESAKADYTKAILLKEDFDLAYLNRGLVKLKLNDYTGAKKDLAKAQKLNSNLNEAGFFKQEAEMHIKKMNQDQKDVIDLFENPDESRHGKAQ